MPEEPSVALTLEEAMILLASNALRLAYVGRTARGDTWIVVRVRDDTSVAYRRSWPDAVSDALGMHVVERDPAAELAEAVEGLLNALPSATTHPAIAAARAALARYRGES